MKIRPFPISTNPQQPFLLDEVKKHYPSNCVYSITVNDINLINSLILELLAIYEISSDGFFSSLSGRVLVKARSLGAYFLYTRTNLPLAVIGAFLGGRSHSVIVRLIDIHEKNIQRPRFKQECEFALKRLVRKIPHDTIIRSQKSERILSLEKKILESKTAA